MLRNPKTGRGLTVPLQDPVKRGTLRAILRQTGLEVDGFLELRNRSRLPSIRLGRELTAEDVRELDDLGVPVRIVS